MARGSMACGVVAVAIGLAAWGPRVIDAGGTTGGRGRGRRAGAGPRRAVHIGRLLELSARRHAC